MVRAVVLALAALVAACGGGGTPADDDGGAGGHDDGDPTGDGAAPELCIYPDGGTPLGEGCWLDELPAPSETATVTMGTGEREYAPMPDVVPLVRGMQNGFHVVVNARITGMEPGDPRNVLCPSNPKTRINAYFVESGDPITIEEIPCGSRVGYKSDGEGGHVMPYASAAVFDNIYQEEIFGQEIRIFIEVVDLHGHYATDERVVTVVQPVGWADAGPFD